MQAARANSDVGKAATSSVFDPVLRLGEGGMGTATLCRSIGAGAFERLVVVKRPHPHLLRHEGVLDRFIEEAMVTASVHHANVIGTQQVGFDEQGPFIVLEYIEGASLDRLLEKHMRPLSVPVALRIILDSLYGLHAVHTATTHDAKPLNIVHRDISLQNLLVGSDGICRVADFGASKSDLRSFSTDQRYLLGKLLYLPPEYLQRQGLGPTLDIYSLGITLWHALTGRELWQGKNEAQIIPCIMEGQIPKVSDYVEVPPQIDELVACATHGDPTERYQSAEEMAQVVEGLAKQAGWVAPHSEVARLVKQLVHAELEARREQVAGARRSAPAPVPIAPTPIPLDVPKSSQTTPARRVTPSSQQSRLELDAPVRPAKRRWLAWVALACSLAAAAAWLVTRSPVPETPRARTDPEPVTPASPVPRSAPEGPSVAAVITSSPAIEANEPEESPATPSAEPVPAVPRPPAVVRRAPAETRSVRRPRQLPDHPPAISAPDRVTRTNPYR